LKAPAKALAQFTSVYVVRLFFARWRLKVPETSADNAF
jgi:hypothetical protein